ncbi:hypothetical protein [Aliiruegeria sabulilitoris]|uniref:hypothetical protein n=1 Tax=Aliiruegeria sabulilitoris TaxID=1510458 RepID=UPI000831CAD5|nr:hypothetical protein [Aliiruegeria sabulilitoris]NDR58927.1 glycosyltransferase family 2 protein [Pseudoruegeria sp. M32A2M]
MSQVPATPKPRRVLIQAAAATLGPRWTYEKLATQWSEQEALERRAHSRPGPVQNPAVVFLTPLVGRHHVDDWCKIEERLADTVESFRRQSSNRWQAVICGQDRPEGICFDEQVRFLPFTKPFEGNDKWAKLEALFRALPDLGVASGYAMPFDADDMLAPGAVAEMIERKQRGGYLVTRGWVLDAQSREIGLCAPQTLLHPGRKAFWKMCGSCAAFRFDFSRDQRDAEYLAAVTSHEHRMFPYLASLAGRRLSPLQQEAVLYVVNHGENFGKRRGRVGFKTRYVKRFPVTDPGTLARIEAEFPMA